MNPCFNILSVERKRRYESSLQTVPRVHEPHSQNVALLMPIRRKEEEEKGRISEGARRTLMRTSV